VSERIGLGKNSPPVTRKGDAGRRGASIEAPLAREDSTGGYLGSVQADSSQARKRTLEKVGKGSMCCHPFSVQGLSLSREASVMRAGAACEPRESGAGERRARAHAGAAWDGDQAVVWACSRVVVVAEVDERRLVQTERSGV
jgi:hypothetical protein